jgi:PAS domain S-box-containing protein
MQDLSLTNDLQSMVSEPELAVEDYRLIAESSHNWEYLQAPDGRLRFVSPSVERITGYLPQDFLQNPGLLREIILPQDRALWDAHRRVACGSPGFHEVAFRIRSKSRGVKWIEHVCRPVPRGPHASHGIRASNRDVTRRILLEREVLEISDFERARMGEELHDGVCQELTGALAMASSLASLPEMLPQAAVLARVLQDALRHARDVAHGLAPTESEWGSLAAMLATLCERIEDAHQIQATFRSPPGFDITDPATAFHLYRIAQEAAQNAVRHGRCTSLLVTLDSSGRGQARLGIVDNGRGFPQEQQLVAGLGIRSMNYRARLLGAIFRIRRLASPATGSEVICVLGENCGQPPADIHACAPVTLP